MNELKTWIELEINVEFSRRHDELEIIAVNLLQPLPKKGKFKAIDIAGCLSKEELKNLENECWAQLVEEQR